MAAALALAACSPPQPEHAHDVVLIVLDTVRADHVSCYGYARKTTPNLDALAAGADRYTLARSTAPWTLPSHASLFTGRFTYQHGADSRVQADGSISDGWPLGDDQTTLAEALKGEGFRTGAFVANKGYVTERNGLAQGFSTFFNDRVDAPSLSAKAEAWLAEPNAKPPSFLFLNYMDAHRPYSVAPLAGARANDLPPPSSESPIKLLDELYDEVFAHVEPPEPALVQRVIDAYDLGIANDDVGLGQLLDALKARGLFDDALIIVTADHGEYLGEHDLVEHSKDVYETALRVPLIVKLPGQKQGRVIDKPISLADVAKLVVGTLPRETAARLAPKFPGTNAQNEMFAELEYSRPKDLAAPWGERFKRERCAIYEGRYKLIRSSDGKHELYDLRVDPKEEHNLFVERADDAALLMRRLESLQAEGASGASTKPARPLTTDELKALRDLGY
jgi:arylsulfatase A-like enzyme